MANVNKNMRKRNEYLEKQIKNVQSLYTEYQAAADKRIMELADLLEKEKEKNAEAKKLIDKKNRYIRYYEGLNFFKRLFKLYE